MIGMIYIDNLYSQHSVIYSDEPQGEMNNHIETNQRNTTANLPDVAQDLYEEIHEPAQMPIGTCCYLTVFHIMGFP